MRSCGCVLLLMTWPWAAAADEVCDAVAAKYRSAPRPGIYASTPTKPDWHPFSNSETTARGTIAIAYLRSGRHAGAVALKTLKPLANGDAPATTVTLRRRNDIAQCEVSSIVLAFWRLFPIDYEIGIRVAAKDYNDFHRERRPNADLEGYHVKYVGRDLQCKSTADSANGNREQFLFAEDRKPDNPYAKVLARITVADQAVAATLLDGAAYAETFLSIYPATSGCASMTLVPEMPGSYALRFNDLEARDIRSLRTPELKRKLTVVK